MIRCAWLVFAGGLMFGSNDEGVRMKELARFEGVWSFALVEVEGAKQPEAPYPDHRMIISKDGRYVVVQDERITPGVLKVDPTQAPKHYDVAVTGGPGKGLGFPGIYEFQGDRYKICVPLRGGDRPSDFASTPGSGRMLQVFKREWQDVKAALIEVARCELAGTWRAVQNQSDEGMNAKETTESVELSIDLAGKATLFREGKFVSAAMLELDPPSMSLDLTYTEGDLKGQSALGIYKIEDDRLALCQAAPGKPRPPEFTSDPGGGCMLTTYKRDHPTTR